LNFLSDKDPSKNLHKEGEVLINGTPRDKVDYFQYLAYVQQDDILLQSLTVKEWLVFAAKMKLPNSVNHEDRVCKLIEALKLEKAQHTKIGGPMIKGVSGGERKRTSIGVELITDPSLIFLDEPTTGLDSFTAYSVAEVLMELAISGRTIIATIHQPNSETFDLFDQLMLMADGKTIYLNDAIKSVDYFSKIGYACPSQSNPADYFMNIISLEADIEDDLPRKRRTEMENNYKKRVAIMNSNYENSELKCDVESVHPEANPLHENKHQEYRAGFFKQLFLLSQRSFRNIFRIPLTSYFKLITTVIISLITILVYGQLGTNQQSIQSRNGLLYFVTVNTTFNLVQTVVLVFPEEKPVFLREHGNRMYSSFAYYIANVVSNLPSTFISSTLSTLIYYFAVELNTTSPARYFVHYGVHFLLSNAATSMGLMIGASFNDKSIAVGMLPVIILPFMLVGGFFVNQNNFVPVLLPFEYTSIFKYSFQAFVLNEYKNLDLDWEPKCDPLGELDFEETLEESIVALACLCVGFYVLAYLILFCVSRKSR
jgi:ATP-binding cassette, subfamily G (WHITE), eye pigment precursor transporter